MQRPILATLLVGRIAFADETGKDPLGAVVGLCTDLAEKIESDGNAEEKAYRSYAAWCDDVANENSNEIKAATAQKGKLEASIDELTSEVEVCDTKISELVEAISQNSKDLAAATSIRKEEASVFAKNDVELADVVDTLGRAIGTLQKQMGGAAFAQISADSTGVNNMLQALNAVIDAASFTVSDKEKLVALVQSHEDADDEDGDSETAAPDPAAYKKKSGGILDVLEDMKEKAEGQLSELRQAELKTKSNFAQLKQSLDLQIADDNFDLADQKKKKAGSEEGKATAEGELEVTVKDITSSQHALKSTQKDCMTVASDHEGAVTARAEELKVVKQAIKILEETIGGGALVQTDSFAQMAMTNHHSTKVGAFLRKLARKHKEDAPALAQLASRINSVIRNRASADPFAKVRGMIEEMLDKLEKSMGDEAMEKAYCDEEMGKSEEKQDALKTSVAKLSNKIDQSASKSAELKEQVTVIQDELATAAKEQAVATKVREEENAIYAKEKADINGGLSGVRKALDVLRGYYGAASAAALLQDQAAFNSAIEQPSPPAGHSASSGAGGSIISILEVAESDMAKALTKLETEEADASSAFDTATQEFKITKAGKDQDVKYKSGEAAGLDKSITELSNDRDQVNTELGAVNAYDMKLQERCVAKPVSYEERKKAREAELEGLKEALNILENEAALAQTHSSSEAQQSQKKHRHMRGAIEADQEQ
jgi:hypothetical protein